MRITPAIAFCFLIGVFSSCQKEFSVENGNNRVKGLLVKTVAVTGSDTLTTLYTYDNLSRLETETTDGTSSGDTIHHYIRFTRDFTTRITGITEQVTEGSTAYDSMRTRIYYNDPLALEYSYSVTNTLYAGLLAFDSTVYTFDTSKLLSAEIFTSVPDLAIPYTLTERNDFFYNSEGNVEKRDYYTLSGGGMLFTTTFNYAYDGAPDYGWYTVNGAQNYLLVGLPNMLSKNVSRLDVIDQTGNAQNLSVLTKLDVGDDQKPNSGVVTISALNRTTRYTFYYQ